MHTKSLPLSHCKHMHLSNQQYLHLQYIHTFTHHMASSLNIYTVKLTSIYSMLLVLVWQIIIIISEYYLFQFLFIRYQYSLQYILNQSLLHIHYSSFATSHIPHCKVTGTSQYVLLLVIIFFFFGNLIIQLYYMFYIFIYLFRYQLFTSDQYVFPIVSSTYSNMYFVSVYQYMFKNIL